MFSAFEKFLLKVTHSLNCQEVEVIQSLWSGYGKISRYQLGESPLKTVVVKCISLSQVDKHPRGWDTSLSHDRKVKSYEVETNWYEQWGENCIKNCRIPKFIGSFSEGSNRWIILEDLDVQFPVRKGSLELSEVKTCLKWLASFHATNMNQKPSGLWEVGTYWHLATRPDEFEKIKNQDLKTKAHLIDQALNDCKYQTIVHGDAKLANFCFSENEKEVAAVDFQYVGGGCGMKDVAYFLGSCLSSSECELYEGELLNFYFAELIKALKPTNIDFKELEQEWRNFYPYAVADFTRFILGWMPSHQKVNAYSMRVTNIVLIDLN